MIHMSVSAASREEPVRRMMRAASIEKNDMFLRAHTTASVPKRQHSVLMSKYPAYSASGRTRKADMTAARNAIASTIFLFRKAAAALRNGSREALFIMSGKPAFTYCSKSKS